MKRLFLLVLTAGSLFSCKNETKESQAPGFADVNKIMEDTTSYTTIKWERTEMNFGVIKEGEKVPVKFKFTNSGNKPLYITSATPGCGCTVTDFPKKALAPGESGEITGEYNSSGNGGNVTKFITVVANTKPENMQKLSFTGEVKQ